MRVQTDDRKQSGDAKVLRLTGGTSQTETDGEVVVNVPGSGGAMSVNTKTSNYTLTVADTVILGNATGGAFTLTLPPAASATGLAFLLRKVDSSGNTITVDPNGSETIDGNAASVALISQWDSLSIVSDGANWQKIDNTPSVAGGGSSPWATTLHANASIGGGTITVNDTLPAALLGTWFYVIIDAWTVNAEAARVNSVSGKVWTLDRGGSFKLQAAHSAGASVLIVTGQQIYVDWFGASSSFSGDITQTTAGINRCLNQLQYFGGNGYGFNVSGQAGFYFINDQVVLPASGLGSLGLTLNCSADFGSGKFAIANPNGSGAAISCAVFSSNSSMTFAQYVAGGRVPPVAMDGIDCRQRQPISSYAQGFRAGIVGNFPDHSEWTNCKTVNNQYGYYFNNPGGISGGDMKFDKCDAENNFRSHWGCTAVSGGPQGSSFKNCSWFNAPFVFYAEGASGHSPGWGEMDFEGGINQEFVGNSFMYFEGGGSVTLRCLAWAIAFGNGGTPDASYPAAAAIDGGFVGGGTVTVADSWLLIDPGGATTQNLFGNAVHSLLRNRIEFNALGQQNMGSVPLSGGGVDGRSFPGNKITTLRGVDTLTQGRWEYGEGTFGLVTEGAGTSVTRGALLESKSTSYGGTTAPVIQPYQTSGAAPVGVSQEANTAGLGVNSNAWFLQRGVARINVNTGNTIAAQSYVKPDASNPGCVVQATGFSDGPIVGVALFAHDTSSTAHYLTSSDRSVLVRLIG